MYNATYFLEQEINIFMGNIVHLLCPYLTLSAIYFAAILLTEQWLFRWMCECKCFRFIFLSSIDQKVRVIWLVHQEVIDGFISIKGARNPCSSSAIFVCLVRMSHYDKISCIIITLPMLLMLGQFFDVLLHSKPRFWRSMALRNFDRMLSP